mgnify:CR=1 FL=1
MENQENAIETFIYVNSLFGIFYLIIGLFNLLRHNSTQIHPS